MGYAHSRWTPFCVIAVYFICKEAAVSKLKVLMII